VLQFDQTQAVYSHPAAVEVGLLFGDPPMMFFPGKIDQQMRFTCEDDSFSIDVQGNASELAAGQEVILGLRPTDVKLTAPGSGQVQGEIYSVQNQFDRELVTLKTKDQLFDIVAPVSYAVTEGDKVGVAIPAEVCYFFDKATHKTI
jgi:multiple sugar transport system ATP-binding protein